MALGAEQLDSKTLWFQREAEKLGSRSKFDRQLSQSALDALPLSAPPSRNQEPWRYTNVEELLYREMSSFISSAEDVDVVRLLETDDHSVPRLVFVDGTLRSDLSRLRLTDPTFFVGGAEALRSHDDVIRSRAETLLSSLSAQSLDSFGAMKLAVLNQASFEDCAFVSGSGSTDMRVEVVFVTTGSAVSSPRLLVDAGQDRLLHIVETHVSMEGDTSLSNGISRLVLAEGARVQHDFLQQKAEAGRLVASLDVDVAQNATYKLRVVQSGGQLSRVNASVTLAGPSSSCELLGVLVAGSEEQMELHTSIHHAAPLTTSKQIQRNIAADTGECIFRGTVRVDQVAQESASSQMCRSLLLSKRAKVKVVPCLQIKADGVQCSHGAAVAQLDEDMVFYMASRGMSDDQARNLLLTAYPQDVVSGLSVTSPKANQRVLDKLVSLLDRSRLRQC